MNTTMSEKDFEEVLEYRLAKIKEVLGVKAKEYVRNGDRLHNFNRAAEARRTRREVAIQGMADKHWISILDMIDDIADGYYPEEEYVDEKIGDAINYLVLLEASIKDNLKKQKKDVF